MVPIRIFERRFYFLGITSIKLRKNYKNDNCYYDFLRKLRIDIMGGTHKRTKVNLDGEKEADTFYTGTSCLLAVKKGLEALNACAEDFNDRCKKMVLAGRTICENYSLINRTMGWFINSMAPNNEELHQTKKEFEAICKKLNVITMLIIKFQQTKDDADREHICKELKRTHGRLKKTLLAFYNESVNTYSRYLYKTLLGESERQ